ncbi:bifunctional diguanylate cyclase/phosphodiesterase [Marinobacter piscensis]|uniref:bifunctional diguanylate cyclase/phosphodiesterase n=1 Tax=Marinobacter piscensis TaxID=1562308 RepID=UPI0011A06250|nr:GGDEF domain-containing protein [Marinobacter piscensis]
MSDAQQEIHELIIQHHPLEEILESIAAWVGHMMPGALVSIMRFDAATNSLSLIPSKQFSERYVQAMQAIPVSAHIGTCGCAAHKTQPVITESIATDPKWEGYRQLAADEGLQACWSVPILTAKGNLLGTFATYYRKQAVPTTADRRNLSRGAALAALAILRHIDIAARQEHEALLAYQANHDRLTGLPNQSRLEQELARALNVHRTPGTLAVLYLNMDGFKPINDELGHLAGNHVITTIAERLQNLVRPGVTLARLVGDEFCLLVPYHQNRSDVTRLADRILTEVSQPIEIDKQMVHISASIGIACNDMRLTPHEILQFAHAALERAKRQGRNAWQWHSSPRVCRSKNNVNLRHDLHTALQQDQFEIYYQPMVDALTGRMHGVEALVRWHHPEQGIISPGNFIPLAEKTGQIVPLGLWILEQACTEMAFYNQNRAHVLRVAVNISSLQFIRDGFFQEVQRVLQKTGLPPRLLELEITESVLLDGTAPVIKLMQSLKSLGVRVALDDFGTGFSSLSYLRDLPTHKVKLDRNFIAETATDHRIAAIVEGIITMSHHMDMAVVAEGIETRQQREDLTRRNCDLLQGYLFARPMPLAQLCKLPEHLPGHP